MLEISVEGDAVLKTFSSMVDQLKTFPNEMGKELTTWQTDDMHRKYPNTSVNEDVVETDIWPTSRLAAEQDKKKAQAALKARKAQRRQSTVRSKGGVSRPILRSELYDKLVDRMDELMSEKLSWR